jgi:hypothetical protein
MGARSLSGWPYQPTLIVLCALMGHHFREGDLR